ncbi:Glutamate--tRNA ligase [Geodia barretti]|uniref:Nondiscriminating glutamyl-tRNA synthetase EARS2, mitochondrial n=1 Tax=Geodia barretti TaxID=519541 RepID=A0AA35WRN4_GEOBA|nr:Glutamate--tRNA ligase [Geodia barretti]
MGVRVRFAPSPTGLLHLGGARTALFNYLFASGHKGQCILRIEDTDQGRLVPGSKEGLEESLQWLGVQFHESPSKGGPYGPYIQSERLSLYQQYARELLNGGSGYPCFCGKERLQSLRQRGTTGYDRRCRKLSRRQANEEMSRGSPFTVRLKVPENEVVCVEDAVYGRVEIKSSTIEDQVLLKTDGFPTYHFACVVDDHCMEISHVLRGEEWLLSTAKHCLLYSSLGWKPPQFVHLPLLVSSTGEKLSKRLQGTSVLSYQERGFLAEAVAEFLCRLGWSGGGEREGRSLEELAANFSLSGISRSPATVDEGKLMSTNKRHFRRHLHDPESAAVLARKLAECVKTTLTWAILQLIMCRY